MDSNVEEKLLEWIYSRDNRMLRVSGKFIMTKAKALYDDTRKDGRLVKALLWLVEAGFKSS